MDSPTPGRHSDNDPAPPQGAAVDAITVEVPDRFIDLASALKQAETQYKVPAIQQSRELARLSFGQGKITAGEYYGMRLFDSEGLAGADKAEFVGIRRSVALLDQINSGYRWAPVLDNKVVFAATMSGLGYRVARTLGIFGGAGHLMPGLAIADADQLRAFLSDPANYPMFGKPIGGSLSAGSESLARVEPDSGTLITTSGAPIPIEAFVETIARRFAGSGYLFQERLSPHPNISAICGDSVPTVRVVTLNQGEPQIFGVAWKIPAAGNVADNFWRPGNLLAEVDPESGVVLRVVRGSGLDQETLTHHPDSGVALVGFAIPQWSDIIRTTKSAAGVFSGHAVIGWDVAATDGGCAIVEGNPRPDLRLLQYARRRGVFDEAMRAALQRQAAKRTKPAGRVPEILKHLRKELGIVVRGKARA